MVTAAAERRRRRKNRSRKKTERRRRRKNKSKKKMNTAGAITTTTLHDLPDHILERILLCLGPSPCLVHAAAACRVWCRVVADAGFLARLRSAHPHGTRLGHYHGNGFFRRRFKSTAFVPSLPAAAIVVRHRRRFNLDFLPGGGGSWELMDSRGGLLLLANVTHQGPSSLHFHLLVCEPLTGRHQVFLRPSGLTLCFLDAFLVDDSGDDSCRIGMSKFRILAVAHEYIPLVFSSGSDGGLHLVRAYANGDGQPLYKSRFVGRANGSIYWGIRGRAAVLVLDDEATVHFSVLELPGHIWAAYNDLEHACRVIGGEDGALRIVRLMSNELKVFVQRRHPASNGSDDEWMLEKHLGLPDEATMIATANSKYVILTPKVIIPSQTLLFSVELDTLRVEREHERNKYNGEIYPYELPWPPVLPDIT